MDRIRGLLSPDLRQLRDEVRQLRDENNKLKSSNEALDAELIHVQEINNFFAEQHKTYFNDFEERKQENQLLNQENEKLKMEHEKHKYQLPIIIDINEITLAQSVLLNYNKISIFRHSRSSIHFDTLIWLNRIARSGASRCLA